VSLAGLLIVVATFGAFAVAARLVVDHPLDAGSVMLVLLAIDMLIRPAVLAIGVDRPFPDDIFEGVAAADLLVAASPYVWLWLAAVVVGHSLVPARPPVEAAKPVRRPDPDAMVRVTLVLCAVSACIAVALIASAGSISGFTRAAKLERQFGQTLRVPAFLTTTFGVAAYLTMRRDAARFAASRRRMALGAAIVGAVLAYLWGARDAAIFGAISIVVGRAYYAPVGDRDPTTSWIRSRGTFGKVVLGLAACVGLTVGLRVARDHILYAEVRETIRGESIVRQVSVATNNTTFDSFALALRTWPDQIPLAGGADFGRGAAGLLPSIVVGRQEPYVSPAVALATYYEPTRKTGWTIGPIGEWYVNFGTLGVFFGGVVSGVVIRLLQRRLWDVASEPLAWTMGVMLVGRVFPGGVLTNSAERFVLLGVPMLALAHAVSRSTITPAVVALPSRANRSRRATSSG
jgi:hypothetical protein